MVQEGLRGVVEASERLPLIAVVGFPLQVQHVLFNCAAVVYRGRVLGVVPKTYLPNYREFYEARYFASGDVARDTTSVELLGQSVAFGSRLLFQAAEQTMGTQAAAEASAKPERECSDLDLARWILSVLEDGAEEYAAQQGKTATDGKKG